jgi:uncharacterized protein
VEIMGFIKQIEIENFYSVKNKIIIDFESSHYMINNHIDRTFSFSDKHYSILNAIYGANASGKSSILRALVAISMVINNTSDDKFPISFKNKFNSKIKKSKINISFVVNEKEYFYKLTFKSNEFRNIGIENEVLYSINNNKKRILFDRSKKRIENIDSNIKNPIFEKLNDKKSLLYEFFKFDKDENYENILIFFRTIGFTSNITNAYITDTSPSKNKIERAIELLIKEGDIFGLKEFILNFLNNIGLDFENFIPNYKENENGEKLFDSLFTTHKISKKRELEFVLESDGTMNLIQILINIFLTKLEKSILVVDEFDSILHPMLVPLINKILLDNKIQVIYTTHNIYNMKFLYHDEILIVDKDDEHITSIKQLKLSDNVDFSDNILDLYEEGCFGGIPDIKALNTKIGI